MPNEGSETISIKRYPNRRLYDSQARRYVTLHDIENLVLQGKQIEVRDSKTGEDLTRVLLAQILIEQYPEKMEMFPVAMLHGMLRADDLMLGFLRTYLTQSLTLLENLQHAAHLSTFLQPMGWMSAFVPRATPLKSEQPAGPLAPLSTLEAVGLRIRELENRIGKLETPQDKSGENDLTQISLSSQTAGQEVQALDQLEKRLQQLEGHVARQRR
jgi:polyhydroxyalkanoate synthesis repressor PhaR